MSVRTDLSISPTSLWSISRQHYAFMLQNGSRSKLLRVNGVPKRTLIFPRLCIEGKIFRTGEDLFPLLDEFCSFVDKNYSNPLKLIIWTWEQICVASNLQKLKEEVGPISKIQVISYNRKIENFKKCAGKIELIISQCQIFSAKDFEWEIQVIDHPGKMSEFRINSLRFLSKKILDIALKPLYEAGQNIHIQGLYQQYSYDEKEHIFSNLINLHEAFSLMSTDLREEFTPIEEKISAYVDQFFPQKLLINR